MRLVEFLISLMTAHAQTLQRLAALFGEEEMLEMLETAGESEEIIETFEPKALSLLREAPLGTGPSSPYAELEGAIHDLGLSEVQEFHLWAYPLYRAYIESELDLNTQIKGASPDCGPTMVDEAIAQAEAWVRKLPIPPSLAQQAERAAQVPWLRFRTDVLKRIGRRPLGPVY